MKRILCLALVFCLCASTGLTARAEGSDTGDDGGFTIEEMPAFGEEDVLTFSSEGEPEPTAVPPSDPAPPAETQPAQTITPTETPTPEKVGGTPAPSSAQEPTPAPEPQPNRAASGLRDNLPVMIVVAVVALGALAAAVVKKRKTTNRPPEAKRPNDIGGRK